MSAQAGLEVLVHARSAEAIRSHEHRMPAPRPPERRRRALHIGAAFGRARIVWRGDGTLLRAECLRRIAPGLLDVFRIHTAESRQRVRDADDGKRWRQNKVRDGARPDVALRAVADAI